MADAAPPAVPGIASPWLRRCWFEANYLFHRAAMTLAFSLRVKGQRHVPKTGPALIVSNHQSFLDPPMIGLAVRRELIYLARKTLFKNPVFAAYIRSVNAVPIDQEGVGKEGIRTIVEQLQQGRAVLVFPEGERTWKGPMLPLKPGVHLLIKRTQAPIVPVGIAGAYDAWPRWRKYPIPAPLFWPSVRGACAIVVGKPFDSRQLAEMPRDEALQMLFDKIHAVQQEAEKLRRRP